MTKYRISSKFLNTITEAVQKLSFKEDDFKATPPTMDNDGNFTSDIETNSELKDMPGVNIEKQDETENMGKEELVAQAVNKLRSALDIASELDDIIDQIQKSSDDEEKLSNVWEPNDEGNDVYLQSKDAHIFQQNDNIVLSHDGQMELFKTPSELHNWLKANNYPEVPAVTIHESAEIQEGGDSIDRLISKLINNIYPKDLYSGKGKNNPEMKEKALYLKDICAIGKYFEDDSTGNTPTSWIDKFLNTGVFNEEYEYYLPNTDMEEPEIEEGIFKEIVKSYGNNIKSAIESLVNKQDQDKISHYINVLKTEYNSGTIYNFVDTQSLRGGKSITNNNISGTLPQLMKILRGDKIQAQIAKNKMDNSYTSQDSQTTIDKSIVKAIKTLNETNEFDKFISEEKTIKLSLGALLLDINTIIPTSVNDLLTRYHRQLLENAPQKQDMINVSLNYVRNIMAYFTTRIENSDGNKHDEHNKKHTYSNIKEDIGKIYNTLLVTKKLDENLPTSLDKIVDFCKQMSTKGTEYYMTTATGKQMLAKELFAKIAIQNKENDFGGAVKQIYRLLNRTFFSLTDYVENLYDADQGASYRNYLHIKESVEMVESVSDRYPWLKELFDKDTMTEDDVDPINNSSNDLPNASDNIETIDTDTIDDTNTDNTNEEDPLDDFDLDTDLGGLDSSLGGSFGGGSFGDEEADETDVMNANMPKYRIIDMIFNDDDPEDIKVQVENIDTGEIEFKKLYEVNL